MPNIIYCLDTSSLVTAWRFTYPPEIFSSLWVRISELVETGRIIAPIEVHDEIKKKDDDLAKWVKKNKQMFQELDESAMTAMLDIMARYPNLIDANNPNVQADPYVIALARSKNATVITEEKPDGALRKKTKIPTVCNYYSIKWLPLLDAIRDENWSF